MKKVALLYIYIICGVIVMAQGVPANVPTNGLMAYYGFDGNANDLSGNNNNGTLGCDAGGSNPSLTSDRFGNSNKAYEFGGVDNRNWIKVNNSTSLRLDTAFSISFWMLQNSARGEVIPAGTQTATVVNNNANFTIFAKGGVGIPEGVTPAVSAGFRMQSTLTSSNTQDFQFSNTNTTYTTSDVVAATTFNCYSTGQWIHVVYTLTPRYSRYYINGVLYQEDALTNSFSFNIANTKPLYFGRLDGGDQIYFPYSGALDDIALYNRELTEAEVLGLYNNYQDSQGLVNRILMDSVMVINPCGANEGRVSLYPHAEDGITYSYALNRPTSPQSSNTLTAPPGTYHFYVVTPCALWDTTITLICDCTDDPTLTYYDSICPGESGQRGGIETVVDYQFNSSDGWTFGGNWERNNINSNYSSTPDGWGWYLTSPTHRGYSGYSAMCPTYFYGVGYSETHTLTSPAITIPCDPSRATLTFYYLNEDILDDMSGYGASTLYLEWATSSSGPWNSIGGSMGPTSTWKLKTVSLAALGSSGTFYFRIRDVGNGYVAGIDNFKITCDTRWTIPTSVSSAAGGTTVRIENELENTGLCPITETTLWFIKPKTEGHLYITDPVGYTWNGNTYNESGTYSWNNGGRLKNHYGCDSISYLHLSVDVNNSEDIYESACDQYQWHGRTYTSSAEVSSSCTACNQWGGDSVVTLHLTIYRSSNHDTTVHSCTPYYWQGTSYDENTSQTVKLTSVGGCDSVLTLHFFRHYKDTTEIVDSICSGTVYPFDGRSLIDEGKYTAHLMNIAGCDSTVNLTLQVIQRPDIYTDFSFDCATGRYVVWGMTRSDCYHVWRSDPEDPDLEGHEGDDTINLKPTTNHIYTYFADRTAGRSCPSSIDLTLPAISEVKAVMSLHPTYLSLDNLTLTATDDSDNQFEGGYREWYVDGVLQPATGRHMRYSALPTDDSLTIMLAINNGLCSDTTWASIPIIRTSIYLPSVFTPTLPASSNTMHEGNNRFRAMGIGITHFEIHIFNRSGLMVFQSTDINEPWYGMYRGELCPQGIYTYIVKYKDRITPGNWQYTTGTVLLLH